MFDQRLDWSRKLLRVSGICMVLFFVINIILQLLPPHYSLVSQAVSDLAVGPFGWIMGLGLFISGLSILTFVAGAWTAVTPNNLSKTGLLLLAMWGIASLVLGFFPPDIIDAHGYPGTQMAFALSNTMHGKIHLVIASISFLSMVPGLLITSLYMGREPRLCHFRPWFILLSLAALIGLLLIDVVELRGIFGVMERAVSLMGFIWIALVARLLR